MEIMARLEGVFHDVFDDPSIKLTPSTNAADIDSWDSLTHINLVVAVEKEFGIRFDLKEIKLLENVGQWIDLISRKLG